MIQYFKKKPAKNGLSVNLDSSNSVTKSSLIFNNPKPNNDSKKEELLSPKFNEIIIPDKNLDITCDESEIVSHTNRTDIKESQNNPFAEHVSFEEEKDKSMVALDNVSDRIKEISDLVLDDNLPEAKRDKLIEELLDLERQIAKEESNVSKVDSDNERSLTITRKNSLDAMNNRIKEISSEIENEELTDQQREALLDELIELENKFQSDNSGNNSRILGASREQDKSTDNANANIDLKTVEGKIEDPTMDDKQYCEICGLKSEMICSGCKKV
jgi:hypothetical protein